jgi:hypothetical protein
LFRQALQHYDATIFNIVNEIPKTGSPRSLLVNLALSGPPLFSEGVTPDRRAASILYYIS